MNYIFSRFQDKQNPDRQGYILSKNNKELETLFYDIDKISYLELVQKKKDFLILFAVSIRMWIDVLYY